MPDQPELLAQVASLYYENSLTQDEIARRVGVEFAREDMTIELSPGG